MRKPEEVVEFFIKSAVNTIENHLYAHLGITEIAGTGAINGYLMAAHIRKQIEHSLQRDWFI